jgi:hypothetical protein
VVLPVNAAGPGTSAFHPLFPRKFSNGKQTKHPDPVPIYFKREKNSKIEIVIRKI